MHRCGRSVGTPWGTYARRQTQDPEQVIRWLCVNDLSVGRSTKETLRVLEALQTGELCPCNWTPGDAMLKRPAQAEEAMPWETAEHPIPR